MLSFFKLFKKKNYEISNEIDLFLSQHKYISKKEVKLFKENNKNIMDLVDLYDKGMLAAYCKKNKLNFVETKDYVEKFIFLEKNIDKHNELFIEEELMINEQYLNNILVECDPNIKLDKEQRVAVLSDEDYTLIIAGAGAGKTTTIAAKVKYLVDKKNIKPEEILVISFTNKAVKELKERINGNLKIDCPVTTFHSTGNAIIHKQDPEKLNIATDGYLYNTINEYLQSNVLNNIEQLNRLILFFSYYLDMDLDVRSIETLKNDLSNRAFYTLKSDVEQLNSNIIQERVKTKITINNERVKSIEEARIANFLYMNNIDYDYEAPYEYHIKGAKKRYTPDFTIIQNGRKIYLEHFGITESGLNTRYSQEELNKYKKQMNDKILLHKQHNTNLIYTYSKYNDNSNLLDNLKRLLLENDIILKPREPKEIYLKLQKDKENRYFVRFIKLMMIFINNFKTNGYSEADFTTLKLASDSERNKIFLDVAHGVYVYYQQKLSVDKLVDFQDMINTSTKILEQVKEMNQKLKFKYIFVDEYQDISLQRFNLTKALSEVTNAKIIAVGDDWQSIYSFSGSKLELFTKFEETLGYAKVLKITHTYRNSQELINIAGEFVQKNDSQIKKQLQSPKNLEYPVAIFTYCDDQSKNESKGKSGILEEKAKALTKVLGIIIKRSKKTNSSILLLGRYGFDGNNLSKTSLFYLDEKAQLHSCIYPDINITFLTVHSSKGLGFDDVVIINGEDGLFGFPSQIKNDPVLNLVVSNDHSYDYAEERRLFYVALTRTKNRVYILSPELHPSRFVIELLNMNSKNIYLDNINISRTHTDYIKEYKKCPVCGFPMYMVNNKYYGRRLWVCTNEPEICDFETNDLHGGKTRIRKCPACINGYLFITKRKNIDSYFLGCSNYKSSGSGCNYTEQLDFDSLSEEL